MTEHRLILIPVNTLELGRIPTAGLKIVQIPQAGTVMTVIGWAPEWAAADSISAVAVGRQTGGLFKPPTIVVRRARGAPIELGVVAGGTNRSISPRNVAARDDFLKAIEATLL